MSGFLFCRFELTTPVTHTTNNVELKFKVFISINMNNTKTKVSKNFFTEICEKYDGVEDFINDIIEEIFPQ